MNLAALGKAAPARPAPDGTGTQTSPPAPRPPRKWGRLGAILGFALFFGILLAVPDVETKLALGALAIVAALGWALISALGRLRPATLMPDVDHFYVRLPGAWPGLLGILGCILLALAWLALFLPKFQDALAQLRSDPWMALFPRICIALVIGLPALALAVLIPLLAGLAPLSISAREGRLRLNWLHRVIRMDLAELTVRRVTDDATGAVAALHLVEGKRRFVISAGGLFPGQADFLAQLADWLATHGARIEDGRRLIHEPAWHSQLRVCIVNAISLACVILPAGVAMAAAFWAQWLRTGTFALETPFYAYNAGLVCGVILLLTPLAGWLVRLLNGAWLARRPPDGALPVFIMEDLHGNELLTSRMRPALLREREGMLAIELGGRAITKPILIGKEAILRLEQPGLLRGSLGNLSTPFYRFLCRPVRLAWREETPDGPIVRALSIAARSGWSNGRDRRDERALYKRLATWRAGEAALELAALKVTSPRPGALVAALFLLLCFAVPVLHNHLILTRVRTGAWQSPAQCATKTAIPLLNTHQSIDLDCMLFSKFDPSRPVAPLLLVGNPVQDHLRPLRSGYVFLSSGPYDARALPQFFYPADNALAAALIPPPLRNSEALFPPQVIDLRTGVGRDLHSLPPWAKVVLIDEGRLFFVTSRSIPAPNGPSEEYTYGCIDTPADRLLWQKQAPLPTSNDNMLAVFPDRRRVLFNWHVIDLKSGALRRVESTAPGKIINWDRDPYNSFAFGKKLIRRVSLQSGNSGLPYMTCIEIDPDTARWREVKIPGNQVVLCADEARWLVYEGKASSAPNTPPPVQAFSLYDPATGRLREIFREAPQGQYFLVHGRDEILIYTPGGAWVRRAIPPAGALPARP